MFNYRRYFTVLMFLTESLACAMIFSMLASLNSFNVLVVFGVLAVVFTVITMSLHILVRQEELLSGKQ